MMLIVKYQLQNSIHLEDVVIYLEHDKDERQSRYVSFDVSRDNLV